MIADIILQLAKTSLFTSILIALLLLLTPLLQKRYKARWRYFAWLVIALRLLVPMSISLPQAPIQIELPAQSAVAAVTPPSQERPYVQVDWGDAITPVPNVSDSPVDVDSPNTIAINPLTIAGGVWLAGLLGFLLFQIVSYQIFLRKLKTSRTQETPQPIKEMVWRIGVDMGICRLPEAVVTDAIDAPVLIGVLRPRVLLPHTGYSDEEMAFILRHELVHYRRRDMWYKLVLLLATAVHWFNPLVYLMTVQAAKDIELACDDDVARAFDRETRARYGETILAALPRKRRLEPLFSTHFGSTKQNMKRRLHNLFDMAVKRRGIAALFAVVVCALTITGMATFSFAAATPDSVTNRTDSLIQDFAKYKSFGVIYDAGQDAVYYNGERVRLFVEFKPHNEEGMKFAFHLCYQDSDAAGTLYLEAVNDDSGKLIGIRRLNNEIALDILDNMTAGNNQNNNDIPFVVMDATSVIESHGITATDLTKDKITSDVASWIGQCDKKQGAYILKTKTGSVYTTYIYYNGGGRYPWTIGAENDTISVNLYSNSKLSTTDGYYLMCFTSAKDYTDIHLYLNNSELTYEVGDRIILPGTAAYANPMNTVIVQSTTYHLVDTEQQLRAIGKDSGSLSLNYMLNRDISLTGEWVSIGDYDNPFTGTFNGNGFEIKGLRMTDPAAQFIGLFGYAKGAAIYNVTLRDVDTERAGYIGKHVGAICAIAENSNIYDNQVIESENNVASASVPDKNTVFHLSNGSGKSITQSSSFEAKAVQTLTITAESSIKGGTVDFFLYSPAGNGLNKETRFTFGGSNAAKTVELTAGRWAYNCTGFFESGDIVITGTIRDSASVGAQTSQADRSDTDKFDAEGIHIMENTGTWGDSINRLLPYMSPGAVEKVVNIYLERHLFPNITPPEAARQVASTIEPALKYMTKEAVESAESKIAAYY